eukprot:1249221-Rhodomonas_salina.3
MELLPVSIQVKGSCTCWKSVRDRPRDQSSSASLLQPVLCDQGRGSFPGALESMLELVGLHVVRELTSQLVDGTLEHVPTRALRGVPSRESTNAG